MPVKGRKSVKPEGLQQQKNKYSNAKAKKPSNTVVVPVQASPFQSQVNVRPYWNQKAVLEMQAAFTSYFLTKSLASTEQFQGQLAALYNGMFTMWQRFSTEVTGTPVLANRLQIIHDLISAFEQKTILKRSYSKVSYGWDGITPITSAQYATGWNNWDFIIPQDDDNSYLSPCLVHAPTASDAGYLEFMNIVRSISSDKAALLKEVKSDAYSPLKGDPSAFAKVYGYVGLNPTGAGSWYNSVENEVNVRAPIVAHNVVYPTSQDDRVAEKLTTNEGGPAVNLAPLISQFHSWYNQNRVDFKFLDFNEVVYTLIYWYINAAQLAAKSGDGNIADYQLPCSAQDFSIIVRQSLLTSFKDQWIGQFVGPLAYDTGSGNNFLPFQILGNCYGNENFKKLLCPTLLAENLSMLQTVGVKYNKQKSKLKETVAIPVWGYYTDIVPQFTIKNGETSVPLFAIPPGDQKSLNLVDCTNGNNYVNVNGAYYSNVLDQYNNRVSSLKKYINVCDMANLSPPANAAMILQTRVNGYVPQAQYKKGTIKRLPFPCLAPISNLPAEAEQRKSRGPTLPAPTNVADITIVEQLATFPLSKELYELSYYMILPSIRYDPNSANDILNKTMYQTITYEGLSQVQNTNSNAPAYLARCEDAANMCIEGAGKITSSTISVVLRELTSRGQGGMLSGLLGGLIKNIVPEASGVIDTISTMLPF